DDGAVCPRSGGGDRERIAVGVRVVGEYVDGDRRVLVRGRAVGSGDRRRVVVEDRTDALAVHDGYIDRTRQVERESLVAFVEQVAADGHGHRGRHLARRESQHTAGGRVIARGDGRAVRRRVGNAHRAGAWVGQGDGET